MDNLKERREKRLKEKKKKRKYFFGILFIIVASIMLFSMKHWFYGNKTEVPVVAEVEAEVKENNSDINGTSTPKPDSEPEVKPEPIKIAITISAAGDCTLGSDIDYISGGSFMNEFKKQNNYAYFFENVKYIFEKDDLTIVNLETTLTEATARADKKYKFKGSPEFTNILTEGSVEAVNIANNHSHDYLQKGYEDTISNLEKANLTYFGYDNKSIQDVNGIMVGMLGYEGWSDTQALRDEIFNSINELKDNGAQLVIVSFHWGIERDNYPNSTQKSLAHYAVDAGADLILGHHPHVVQGIEEYNGKNIVYSLSNFCFGGNKNPSDKDTFIFQQTFNFTDGVKIEDNQKNIIPCSISSVTHRNDYKPTVSEGSEKERILNRINKYSIF
ncbi:CapA family protein [Clostridium grantii]|uniref:CapA family protein n=1 Tax=Clostridium grantii TaxID=40575 RepID=UPI001FA9272B|nr:CapA family protein [Clostridium grantii]